MVLPSDDNILLSVINTMLRDKYASLSLLCEEEELDLDELVLRLGALGYVYDGPKNAFK